jgi:hypothetical protein
LSQPDNETRRGPGHRLAGPGAAAGRSGAARPIARSRHTRHIPAPPDRVWHALLGLDFRAAPLARVLLALRGMRAATFADLERIGFVRLRERPPHHLAFGLVGRFWTLRGGLRRVPAGAFDTFNEPGWARVLWTFDLRPERGGTLLATETLVWCTDRASARRFRRYWAVVGPFSGLLRRAMLRLVHRAAVAGADAG